MRIKIIRYKNQKFEIESASKIIYSWVKTTLLLAMAMLLFSRVEAATQYTFYAKPSGSGNKCTKTSPCSLTGVVTKVRSVNGNMIGDIVVNLRGGTYKQTSTLAFTSIDSGTNGYNIVYQAYLNEIPVISGGKTISGWSQHDVSKNIWRASAGTNLLTRQLYVNGQRAMRARSGSFIPGTVNITSTGYITTDTSVQTWSNPADIEFVYTGNDGGNTAWTESRCGVQSISSATGAVAITMKEPCWTNATFKKCCGQTITYPSDIENAYVFLDSPGEWYLDRVSGIIYYIPRAGENMLSANVIAPTLETLVSATGAVGNPVHNIQFKGITFAYATWLQPNTGDGFIENQANQILVGNPTSWKLAPANVAFHTAHNIRLERNTFTHLGAQGLVFDMGSQNNVVIGNVFTDISGTGVRIGDVDNSSTTDIGNSVTNNYIHNVAVEYRGGVGLMGGYVANTSFAHNDIANLPYTGISLGWGWSTNLTSAQNNEIAFNHVCNTMQLLGDGGFVYTLSNQPGSAIHGNYMHNQPKNVAIYHDQGSSNFDDYDNVVAWVPAWLGIPSASQNLNVHNNFTNTNSPLADCNNAPFNCYVDPFLPWPSLAQTIVDNAGLEPVYQNIRGANIKCAAPINLALNKPATASSSWNNASLAANKGNDGDVNYIESNGWAPSPNINGLYTRDPNPWWQVDLGSAYRITSLELVTRQYCRYPADTVFGVPNTRMNFEARASNDPSFTNYVVLAAQGNTPVPCGATWSATVNDAGAYRYIRAAHPPSANYPGFPFFIAEFRVFGVP